MGMGAVLTDNPKKLGVTCLRSQPVKRVGTAIILVVAFKDRQQKVEYYAFVPEQKDILHGRRLQSPGNQTEHSQLICHAKTLAKSDLDEAVRTLYLETDRLQDYPPPFDFKEVELEEGLQPYVLRGELDDVLSKIRNVTKCSALKERSLEFGQGPRLEVEPLFGKQNDDS